MTTVERTAVSQPVRTEPNSPQLVLAPDAHVSGVEDTARSRAYVGSASLLWLAGDLVAGSAPIARDESHMRAMLSLCALVVIFFQVGGLYRTRLRPSFLDDLPALAGRLLAATGLVATITALRHPIPGQLGHFLDDAAIATGLILAMRLFTTGFISVLRRRGVLTDKVVVIGAGNTSREIIDILNRWPEHGLQVIGYVDDDVPHRSITSQVSRLGSVQDLPAVTVQGRAGVVIVGDGRFEDEVVSDVLASQELTARDVYVVSRRLDSHVGRGSFDHIGAIPVTRLSPLHRRLQARVIKRAIDIIASSLGLTLALPILLLSVIALRIESGPGVLFRQTRVGRHGEAFSLLKLRTMTPVSESESDATWVVNDSNRIGPVGRFLRRTCIDELPQLWNILLGHMSLVGPRPERPVFVERFAAEHPRYRARHRVQVGLTGLAQVSGLRGDTSISDRVRHDNYYIENWSLWFDLKVILRTIREVLKTRS